MLAARFGDSELERVELHLFMLIYVSAIWKRLNENEVYRHLSLLSCYATRRSIVGKNAYSLIPICGRGPDLITQIEETRIRS